MKVGDLVRKNRGCAQRGRVGVITRIYNRRPGETLTILEVLSEGKFEQWAASWCEHVGKINESR